MIHECLLNLWNCPDSTDDMQNCLHLFELQEFLHPGEQKLLQIIIDIGMDYHKINAFIFKQIPNKKSIELKGVCNKVSEGLYITAFCSGVHSVLEVYRKEIINLESMFLQNPQLPLTFILSCVEKYRNLFETLLSMIQIIQDDNIHGCLLIGRLHKYIYSGVDQITSAVELIIRSINTIFYRHLCNWIIYGDLVDTYGEFFITDSKTADEDFLYPEQLLELNGEASNTSLTHFKRSKVRRPSIVRKFFINWSMVPLFIDEDTAESILFMGRIVWIIRNDPKKCSDENYQIRYKRDIWEGKDMQYYKKVQDLEKRSFDNIEFQRTMEICRNKLTKYLWSVMLDEGSLVEHLHLIRDYYALGRGELFQQFISVAEKHLGDTASDSIIQSLNFIFLETARKIYGENDKTYLKFELTSSSDPDSDIAKTNPWSRLQINFEIKWPLHIVFHPKVMILYNNLFCYLLRLKKSQIDLNRLWVEQVSRKQKVNRKVWTLLHSLMFLVNNLQYYLQVDVIEAQFSLLLKAVESANEFEDIIKVHHDFISNLLAKTFILTPNEEHIYKNRHRLYQIPAVQFDKPSKVHEIVIKLLNVCDKLCQIENLWEDATLLETDLEKLDKLQNKTETIIETLLFVLYSLHEKASGQHLLQLLLQLDFNRYFSKNKPDLNLTTS